MDLSAHNYFVETDWLYEHLHHSELRIVEATSLLPNYFEANSTDFLKRASGHELWAESHIPGSVFAGILEELSDTDEGRFMYGIPAAEKFSGVMSKLGVGDGTAVILYDRAMNMWAARLWWMLRTFGFDNAAVLNGGYTKWLAEKKPINADKHVPSPTQFHSRFRPDLIADREDVLAATKSKDICLINALDPDEFAGRPPHRYARPGRIPTSVNVPFSKTADPDSQLFSEDANLDQMFDDVGAKKAKAIICYCGGGIAACSTALTLVRLGFENVSVYDGSLTEWAADPVLPMEVGDA